MRIPAEYTPVSPDELQRCASLLDDEAQVDEMAVPSYTHWNPIIRKLFWSRIWYALECLGSVEGQSILDFGTGTGLLLPTLSAQADTVIASDLFADPAREMVKRRGLGNVKIVEAAIPDRESIAEQSLDAIVALDVLEHVEDLPGVIELFRDRLRPGGRVVLSGPTENLVYKLGRVVAGFRGKGHYHHTDIYRIADAFVRQGFRLETTRRLYRRPLPALFYVHEFRRPD